MRIGERIIKKHTHQPLIKGDQLICREKPVIRHNVCLFGELYYIYDYTKYDLVKNEDGSFFETSNKMIAEEKASQLISIDLEQQRIKIEQKEAAASNLRTNN